MGNYPEVSLDHCRIESNGYGLVVDNGRVMIRDSIAVSNYFDGFSARSNINNATIFIENCMATNNQTGITTGSSTNFAPTVIVSNTTITGNIQGVQTVKGSTFSFGNNRLAGNTTDGAFSRWNNGLK